MLKSFVLIFVAIFLSNNSFGQITKNNWLLSGSASFSTLKSSSSATLQFKQTDFQISPTIGYFIIDKFAVGLKPSFTYGKNNLIVGGDAQTIFSIGPFTRYYLLQTDRPFNLLVEGSYSYASFKQGSDFKQNSFSVSAGPVLYFNTSVGLEFIIGYSTTKIINYTGSNNAVRFGIGFQFHLEKEK